MGTKIRNALQAAQKAISSFPQHLEKNIPDVTQWQVRTIYAAGIEDYAVTSKLFTIDHWSIEVYQQIAPLDKTAYELKILNSRYRWFWQVEVKSDGSLLEIKPCRVLSEAENAKLMGEISRKLAIPPPKPGGYGH